MCWQVDVLTRKMWDMFDSDMNLNMFIDHHLKDDKVGLHRILVVPYNFKFRIFANSNLYN